jgi:outer membrane immunogenic protein
MAGLTLMSAMGTAFARPDIPWDGGYLGGNLGEASSSSCSTWALSGVSPNVAATTGFNYRDCASGSSIVGGMQFGENYQFGRLVVGVGADIDFWNVKHLNQSLLQHPGGVLPPGTYTLSGKENPTAFAFVGPRIGYAGTLWMPYLKIGGVIAIGSNKDEIAYTPLGSTQSVASFQGGKNFSTTGWAAGGGFELGLNGAWSVTAEYLHMSLGSGSDVTASCSGTASSCAPFAGFTFSNNHEGFSANVYRIGVTYWFDYW